MSPTSQPHRKREVKRTNYVGIDIGKNRCAACVVRVIADLTSITIYDGSSTIGGNKIYLEDRGRGTFLDLGMNFAKYG